MPIEFITAQVNNSVLQTFAVMPQTDFWAYTQGIIAICFSAVFVIGIIIGIIVGDLAGYRRAIRHYGRYGKDFMDKSLVRLRREND